MTPESSETEPATTSPEIPMDNPHYVLRRGEILGPFDMAQLRELVAGAMLEYDDFVQQAGSSEWLPLRWLLIPDDAQDLDGALAPTWKTLLKWSWLRLRYNLDEQSLSAGWVCLGLALGGLFLSRWPMLLWAPWAVLAFFGGIALYRRDRVGPGISLMLASAIIPGALWAYFWTSVAPVSDRRTAPEPVAAQPAANAPSAPSAPSALVPAPAPATAHTPAISIPPSPKPPEPAPVVANTALVPLLESPTPKPEPAAAQAAAPAPTESPSPSPAASSSPFPALVPISTVATDTPPVAAPRPAASAAQVVSDFAAKIGSAVKSVTNDSTETPSSSSAFVNEHTADLVFVSDDSTRGAGSGFVCEYRGKPALITNIHVAAGMRAPQFTRLDKSGVKTAGAPSAAIGHDILLYSLPPGSAMPKLRVAPNVEDVAAIGDEVFVLGNSEGARVITPLTGKISGLGPELIEVTAEFVPGNSGSPIVHAKSGMVIGIATYLTVRDKKWLSEDNAQAKIRRFGYRLDSVTTWQPIDWAAFGRDRVEFEKVSQLTNDLAKLLRDMGDGVINSTLHTNPAIARHVSAFMDKVGTSTRVHPADRLNAASTLLRFMRTVSQQDISVAARNIRYDYYARSLNEEKAVRVQFAEIFDKLVKELK